MSKETLTTTSYGQWTLADATGSDTTSSLSKAHPIKAPKVAPPSADPATQNVMTRPSHTYELYSELAGKDPKNIGSDVVGVNTEHPDIKASPRGVLGTQHHEALHNLVNAISDQHSPKAAKAYVHHLYQALEPQTREYFSRILPKIGIDTEKMPQAQHHHAMEEVLGYLVSHAHDPDTRSNHIKELGPISQDLDKANKTSLKRIQTLSEKVTPETLSRQPEVDLNGQVKKS